MNRLVGTIYADTLGNMLGDRLSSTESSLQGGDLGELVNSIVQIALPLAGVAAVILLILAGYKMISSQGNPEKLNDAREVATNAIIGLVFILLSVGILVLVASVFEIEGIG